MSKRVRLIVAAVLFVGWLGWLSIAAITKSRAPTVSRAQAAVATVPVVAKLKTGENGKPETTATVVERIKEDGPAVGTEIVVTNLSEATGFSGPGPYLLLLTSVKSDGQSNYLLVGQQRSPGTDLTDVGPPKIYPWSEDVRKQVVRLFP